MAVGTSDGSQRQMFVTLSRSVISFVAAARRGFGCAEGSEMLMGGMYVESLPGSGKACTNPSAEGRWG
jgi:hypothetical protein